jgi:hypothetical protein
MKLSSKYLPMLLAMGLASTACSHFKKTETVTDVAAVGTETAIDRSVAQSREGISFQKVSEGQIVKLARCGGTAKLVRVENVLTLQVRKAVCSNLKTAKGEWKLKGTEANERWINVNFDESVPGERMVLVGSNAYMDSNGGEGNGDYLTVRIPAKRVTLNLTAAAQTKELKLQHCNGTIQASIANGKVVINVSNSGCSKFDILSNDGEQIKYEVKSIPEVSIEAGYSGNFTIPNKFYDRGLNGIVVRLLSPRLTEEVILVKFQAF